jgi:predicted Zn-dependent protease
MGPTDRPLTRRQIHALLSGLAVAGALPALSGCVENQALGRSQLLLVSDSDLAAMAAQNWREVTTKERRSRDAGLQRQLERVGTRVADAAGRSDMPWEFAVFENETPNAWVMPGGKVGFHSGIFPLMRNEAQVATVMGHEMGHVVGRHAAERVSQQIAGNAAAQVVGQMAAGSASPETRVLIGAALGVGVNYGLLLPYSRQHEFEADRLGLEYMAKAGYDPRDARAFWTNMSAASAGRPQPMAFMSTHPSDSSRIAQIEQLTPPLLPVYERARRA